jgi:vancomycin resistance protein YoaR
MKRYYFLTIFFSLALFFGGSFPIAASTLPQVSLSVGEIVEIVPAQEISKWMQATTIDFFDTDHQGEEEESPLCGTAYSFCDISVPKEISPHVRSISLSRVNEERIKEYLETLALKTDVDPLDAVFKGDENGKIVVSVAEVSGQSLDQGKGLELIKEALQQQDEVSIEVALPTIAAHPNIKSTDAERLGLKELIGEGKSNFKGSPKNRVYNIKRSLEQYQSLIIAPGQEFSFVEFLGEVDEANGYLPELVIKDNKTQPEFGGGVCQVSSTVFRAAIFSGMKITERRNHSYPVQYYLPYGMDATIYIPKPDFKFVNNTKNSIMMQSEIIGTELFFRFFGTRDGREVKVDGPYILERNPDGSMKTTFTQIVTDSTGKEIIKDEFKSNYKSPALFPHPGDEKKLLTKPASWSNRQWRDYKKVNP